MPHTRNLVNTNSRNNSAATTTDEDDKQITCAPDVQIYLTQNIRRHSCCSVMLPVAFERAASQSWLDPKFDSPALEGQFKTSVFSHVRMRYRFTLIYILICSIVWFLYFIIHNTNRNDEEVDLINPWQMIATSFFIIALATVAGFIYTKLPSYRAYTNLTSAFTASSLCIFSLAFLALSGSAFSPLGHFTLCLELILIIYTALPMKLWLSTLISVTYSILFETFSYLCGSASTHSKTGTEYEYRILILRILLQVSVHLVGLHVLVMHIVRMRGTFMKIGQNLLVRRQLELEKQLKEKMIHSVMPPKVANILLEESMEHEMMQIENLSHNRPRVSNDVKTLFRPFHMHSMDNVSILFADIVGFTKMSSTKTAEQLVDVLNDLFKRFDDLCLISGCEKISTLGDCYYCVSGCPEPRPDHAICCVEMGLAMIDAMRSFDRQRHEGVKMRVGVHTGTVLCGIVGTKRVKFDVWSNDVTLANRMESTGRPEQVHISETTSNFLGDSYYLEEGDDVDGHKTYFVLGRRKDTSRQNSLSPGNNETSSNMFDVNYLNGVTLSQSATNLSVIQPIVPPASPVGAISASLNPSPILSSRPRVSSLNRNENEEPKKMRTPPKIIVTAKSLPKNLDSDDADICCMGNNGGGDGSKCSSYENEPNQGFLKHKFRSWKVPKFLKKQQDDSKKSEVSPVNPIPDPVVVINVEQNGYQQLPVVIEASKPTCNNTLDIPHKVHCNNSKTSESSSYSPGKNSTFDDIIDVRSYISHSRSDISPFGRTGSCRSQTGSKCYDTLSQGYRPRASTLAARSDYPPQQRNSGTWQDNLSICQSATSRKDSGIKSNSRRSSIQHQINALNQSALSQHRVSGYFTSSTSSLSNIVDVQLPDIPRMQLNSNPMPPDLEAACIQQLRKQSDLQLIKCVKDNAKSDRSYLVKPPLKTYSLYFKSSEMEREFRSKAHRFGSENENEGPPTLATPRYNTYIDIFVGIFIYLCISASLFLLSPVSNTQSFRVWVSIFMIFTTVQVFALVVFTRQMCRRHSFKSKTPFIGSVSCMDKLFEAISSWYPWHICLAILMLCPVILIMVNFVFLDLNTLEAFEYHYGFMLFVCIVHFCNFTQLNCWMRNSLAVITGMCFVGIAIGQLTSYKPMKVDLFANASRNLSEFTTEEMKWFSDYHYEIYIDLVLLLFLVVFLNREFEIGYRLTFYGNAVANKDKMQVQNLKNQADMLLHNIIPKHVAEELRKQAKYSENHHNVGIIFASIVNFNEMYDESYLGGKEYLRVLNELIGDFDELLSRSEFKCIEKIKTIGSTFMAASGLDPSLRGDNNEHIIALMDFAIQMQQVVENFNKDLLEFNLIIRIGLNVGDVAAGVIGTSKLHYDIWGDAVNVASRMDSTGVAGRIQVGSECKKFLDSRFDFEERGSVYVKGKDHMEVFLLKGKRPDLYDADEDDLDKKEEGNENGNGCVHSSN